MRRIGKTKKGTCFPILTLFTVWKGLLKLEEDWETSANYSKSFNGKNWLIESRPYLFGSLGKQRRIIYISHVRTRVPNSVNRVLTKSLSTYEIFGFYLSSPSKGNLFGRFCTFFNKFIDETMFWKLEKPKQIICRF